MTEGLHRSGETQLFIQWMDPVLGAVMLLVRLILNSLGTCLQILFLFLNPALLEYPQIWVQAIGVIIALVIMEDLIGT
jgi:hypothetical protein